MRTVKLAAVLVITIAGFLLLLHFNISFGISLAIAMVFMMAGVRYARRDDPDEKDQDQAEGRKDEE